ncbi:hypothetical protein DQ04_20361000, partial [Trypanosoma grayi]|uniref:hypothetical protein n=1 Tax=Trypanosoma grayi TaxID=71804 RepID=UPI0004F4A0BF
MSARRSRSKTLTFVDDVNNNNNSAGVAEGAAGSEPKMVNSNGSPVEMSPANKSLYLSVATSRAFPYVARWLREKSTEMRGTAAALQQECDSALRRELEQLHKTVVDARATTEQERAKMLLRLQELHAVRRHQTSAGEAWLAG